MSTSNGNKIIGIFFSDPHLSLTPPPLRSEEPDWFAAMKRPFDEIKAIQKIHECPVFCCGDIFDRWNSPPELINWAIDTLPRTVYSIPGQHDLPEHSLLQIERSAYQILVKMNIIPHIEKGLLDDNLWVRSFPFGEHCHPCKLDLDSSKIKIALIHQYNWITGAQHKGEISHTQHVDSTRKEFQGYDFIFSGDNHIPFDLYINSRKTVFVNCGSIIRRKSNDMDWHPSIWLLRASGTIQRYKLNVSKDKYMEREQAEEIEDSSSELDLHDLIKKLGRLGYDILDVADTFKEAFENDPIQQKRILHKAME